MTSPRIIPGFSYIRDRLCGCSIYRVSKKSFVVFWVTCRGIKLPEGDNSPPTEYLGGKIYILSQTFSISFLISDVLTNVGAI